MMETNSKSCDAFADVLNAVLDGDAPMASLTALPHYAACGDCRAMVRAARLLQSNTVTVPNLSNDFASRVVLAVQQSQTAERRQRILVRCGIFALAASLLITVAMVWPKNNVTPTPELVEVKTPNVTASVNEAKNAMASLTAKVAEESYAPARNLIFASADRKVTPVSPSTSEPLADLPDAATAGFEPIATTTRRAFNALLRDVNGLAGTGKKSS